MKLENVCRSRSPTGHVTFQLDGTRWEIQKQHNKSKRKLIRRTRLLERQLVRIEIKMKEYEQRIRELAENNDLNKQYRQLSDAQNEFINVQKFRISDLERQGTADSAEMARTRQLNKNLSATLNSQEVAIHTLEQKMMEDMSNKATIAALVQSHQLSASSPDCLYNEALTDCLPGAYIAESTESDQLEADQEGVMLGNNSSTAGKWQRKESTSSLWQADCWPSGAIL